MGLSVGSSVAQYFPITSQSTIISPVVTTVNEMTNSSSSNDQTIQQHPVSEVLNNYRMNEENSSSNSDNITYQPFSGGTIGEQFYQQLSESSLTVEQSNEEQRQLQQKSQQLYGSTEAYNCGSNHQSPTSSNSSSSSNYLINSTNNSTVKQQVNLFQDQDEYQQHQQQQCSSQESTYQQLQMQQLSSQIDHQPTISSNGEQQLIEDHYSSYNYKRQEDDVCALGNHLNQVAIESTNLNSSNQTYIHHHHLHKTLSSDIQDFNNNHEPNYETNTSITDDLFTNHSNRQRQDNHSNQNQEQLYTSASYFTNSDSDNYHNVSCNLENLQQIEPLVQALPPFESINGSNMNHNQQVQYNAQPDVAYNQYGESEDNNNTSYQNQQLATSLKPSYDATQHQLLNDQHQYWNNGSISQDNSLCNQELSNQHQTLAGNHQQMNQHTNKQLQQIPFDSLQQLSMNCDSYTDHIPVNSSIDLPPDNAQDTSKSRGLKGRRGRPRKKGLRSKNKVNGKLWEFIRDLLLSDRTNPSFIRWERREDGVFKFVQSDKVAKMWGERKQNPKMTYEKLSRAMRYYYKSKVLLPVFGRRLVYKFGPNATGWLPTQGDLF